MFVCSLSPEKPKPYYNGPKCLGGFEGPTPTPLAVEANVAAANAGCGGASRDAQAACAPPRSRDHSFGPFRSHARLYSSSIFHFSFTAPAVVPFPIRAPGRRDGPRREFSVPSPPRFFFFFFWVYITRERLLPSVPRSERARVRARELWDRRRLRKGPAGVPRRRAVFFVSTEGEEEDGSLGRVEGWWRLL